MSILSERRVFSPYGMSGGEEGKRGSNIWRRKKNSKEYDEINVGGKSSFIV